MRRLSALIMVLLGVFMMGCSNQDEIDQLNADVARLNETMVLKIETIEELNRSLLEKKEAIEKAENDINELISEIQILKTENNTFQERIVLLEDELNIKNEESLQIINQIELENKKVLALKSDAPLSLLVSHFYENLNQEAGSHYGLCLYNGVAREGVSALISLIEKKTFTEVDGIIGHFANALAQKNDFMMTSQLMIEAQSLDGSQSPTALYFYARVLYYLSR